MPRTKRTVLLALVGVGALAATLVQTLPGMASEVVTVPVAAAADTTVTQVPQDGDTSARTTLASCPQLCDGNPDGERDAILEFSVFTIPTYATQLSVKLRIYAWHDAPATVALRPASGGARSTGFWGDRPALSAPLGTHPSVRAGYNDWDVTPVIAGNGRYAFGLLQQTVNTRTYWASRENSHPEIRPQLVITYRRDGRGTTPTPTASPVPTGGSTTSAPAGGSTPPAPAGWRLVWSDEFNGTKLDPTKWNARNDTYLSYDRACITNRPQNVSVGDGLLTLRATREPYTCASQQRNFTDAYLDTIGKASFTYGRFEVRAKSPNGPTNSTGLWPAFWLRPDDGGEGEIDVCELPGGSAYYQKATQAIFKNYTPVKQDNRASLPTGYPGSGFHTYTTEWEKGVVRWYIDGVQVWQRTASTTSWLDQALGRPFHLRLNVQTGGWLGDPDGTTAFPAAFQVDYVRVWQR